MNKIYIAGITTILPQVYSPIKIVEAFYPEKFASKRCRSLINKLVHRVGINNRPTVIDLELFPKISLQSAIKYCQYNNKAAIVYV